MPDDATEARRWLGMAERCDWDQTVGLSLIGIGYALLALGVVPEKQAPAFRLGQPYEAEKGGM